MAAVTNSATAEVNNGPNELPGLSSSYVASDSGTDGGTDAIRVSASAEVVTAISFGSNLSFREGSSMTFA